MAKSTSIQNSTWLTLIIAAAALLYFAFTARNNSPQRAEIDTESTEEVAKNTKIQQEVSALGELSAPIVPSNPTEQNINSAPPIQKEIPTAPDGSEIGMEPDEPELSPEITSLVGIDPNNIPEDLPEDLKEQLKNPPELPADLKAQLEAQPPPIPEDIQEALKTPPREITLEEVNNPTKTR